MKNNSLLFFLLVRGSLPIPHASLGTRQVRLPALQKVFGWTMSAAPNGVPWENTLLLANLSDRTDLRSATERPLKGAPCCCCSSCITRWFCGYHHNCMGLEMFVGDKNRNDLMEFRNWGRDGSASHTSGDGWYCLASTVRQAYLWSSFEIYLLCVCLSLISPVVLVWSHLRVSNVSFCPHLVCGQFKWCTDEWSYT